MKTNQVAVKSSRKSSSSYVMKAKAKKAVISIVRGLLIFGLCFMIIQPMVTRFATSLMAEKDLYDSTIVILPRNPTTDNYRIVSELVNTSKPVFGNFGAVREAFTNSSNAFVGVFKAIGAFFACFGFGGNSIYNTLLISLFVSLLQVISCTLVSYGFARYEFPLKKFWFACVVALIIIPPQTIGSSLQLSFAQFDIFGIFKATTGSTLNLRSSVLPYVLMCLTCMGLKDGLYIYMLRQYFRGIPKSLEEAAYVDGCSTLRTFCEIMLPDAIPTIASCFLFSFVWQWTDLFYTRTFLATSYRPFLATEMSTMVSRMSRYFSADANNPVIVSAARQQQLISIAVLFCCIPLVILYCFTQRTFVQSIAMSGSKE